MFLSQKSASTVAKKKCLETIAQLLKNEKKSHKAGYFCESKLKPEDVVVEVEEVGELTYPINKPLVEKLISLSKKAQYGLRDKTLVDENVRNTYEIDGKKLRVSIKDVAFQRELKKITKALGISQNKTVTAHLHNMLIYGPGHFFDTHRDTEKIEHMIGTLVIVLPSAHIGGDLKVSHEKKEHTFSTETIEPKEIKYMAFFADCLHKVEKVKQGHRIALTYNLALEPEKPVLSEPNTALTSAIKSYFDIRVDNDPPVFVYFLNHTYTQHGLRWDMLKGEDWKSSSNLLYVAKELQLLPHLALVEVHECWEARSKKTVNYLIDTDTHLTYWIDCDNKEIEFPKYYVSEDSVCLNVENKSLKPYESEYEGYTGNAGNTMDYWYRRAAVVLWPKLYEIEMNFKLQLKESIKNLHHLTLDSGNESKILEILEKAKKYLEPKHGECDSEVFSILASIGIYLNDTSITFSLLSKFSWSILNASTVGTLANLQSKFGCDWCISLLTALNSSWFSEIPSFDMFLSSLVNHGIATSIIKYFQDAQYRAILKSFGSFRFQSITETSVFTKEAEKLCNLLMACLTPLNEDIIQQAISYSITKSTLFSVLQLSEVYMKLSNSVPHSNLVHFSLLRDHVLFGLKERERKLKGIVDDFSVEISLHCDCEHCKELNEFLQSIEVTKIWAKKQEIRNHIKTTVMFSRLPVKMDEKRTGSPIKLILTKLPEVKKMKKDELANVTRLLNQFCESDIITLH